MSVNRTISFYNIAAIFLSFDASGEERRGEHTLNFNGNCFAKNLYNIITFLLILFMSEVGFHLVYDIISV